MKAAISVKSPFSQRALFGFGAGAGVEFIVDRLYHGGRMSCHRGRASLSQAWQKYVAAALFLQF
jgi:hypothetical protein